MVDETINSCSNILNSSVSKTVNCGSNLSTPQISEDCDQKKNVKKKLDEQLAHVRKQLQENYNSFKSNNELLHYHNKTPPTTLTPCSYCMAKVSESFFNVLRKSKKSFEKLLCQF